MKLQPSTRHLILHADDGGLCHSVNQAIIQAMEIGIITSASLMVPCPQIEEIVDYFKQHADDDVGIHLTLTSEYPHYPWGPISEKEKVPSLVNPNGFFWHTVDDFVAHAKPEDVQTELRAQIERLIELGIRPTHLDTHQGTVFHDLRFLEIYVKLGLEYNIPAMLIKPNEQAFKMMNVRDLQIDPKVIENLMALGIPFLDFLFMMENNHQSKQEREQKYLNVIKNIPKGLSQIILHPGLDDEELNRITPDSKNRYYDYSIFTDSKIKRLINDQNIKLTRWDELKS